MSCISLQMAKFTFSISNNNFILIAILDGAMVLSSKVLFNCYNFRLLSEPVALLLQNLISTMPYYMKLIQSNFRRIRRMSNSRVKTMTTLIALVLTLSMAISLFAVPSVSAAVKTYPFIEAMPNPVGKNQKTLINFGLLNYLNTANDGWNITVTITKPDNSTEILGGGPLKTWSTGNAGHYYVPDTVGTYYLQTSFDAVRYRNVDYLASTSDKLALVVQEAAVPTYPGQALPSEYWTRPIDSQLREWYTLAGSWLSTPDNLYAPYNDGPESAHILWARPIGDTQGGLIGGEYAGSGDHAYGTGDAYEGKWATRLIVGGVLYYSKFESGFANQQLVAVDLRTGEELWTKVFPNNALPSMGMILYWDCLNYRGAFSYLVFGTGGGFFGGSTRTGNWSFYEPLTGEWRFNINNAPSGTIYIGPNGEFLIYSISGSRLLRWNSSYVVIAGRTGMSESWGSTVKGATFNAATRSGYDLNVSIPALATTGNTLPGSVLKVFVDDRVIGGSTSQTAGVKLWGLSLEPGREGQLLFNYSNPSPSEWAEGNITIRGWGAFSQESLVATLWTKENRVHYAYSLETGKFLWQSQSQYFSDAWSGATDQDNNIAYGKLYSAAIGGIVYCYDVKNGTLLWNYTVNDPYHESYISKNWWMVSIAITDGKLYMGYGEHSSLDPKPRGGPFLCLNCSNGAVIWRADGLFRQTHWGGPAIMGDSVIATMDTYDQRVYAIGKGPSATTVTAPKIAVAFGTPVVISGTVMDVSPGTQDDTMKLRFPYGVPAVSDESQSDWMLYVYKQLSRPTDATGVAVSIDAMDPNNNFVHLGDAVGDSTGAFSCVLTPAISGTYTVYATFGGSAAYYGSYATATLAVMPEPAATPAPTPTPVSVADAYFVPAVIGIIATIVIVGVVLLLLLRKRA
jgi:hypothetical protein